MRTSSKLRLTTPSLWAMVAIHAGALLAFLPQARPSAAVLALAGATFAVRTFAVSAGYHRYFSHRAYRTGRLVQFLLAFVGGTAAMRNALVVGLAAPPAPPLRRRRGRPAHAAARLLPRAHGLVPAGQEDAASRDVAADGS